VKIDQPGYASYRRTLETRAGREQTKQED
jgi:hypothetical protein